MNQPDTLDRACTTCTSFTTSLSKEPCLSCDPMTLNNYVPIPMSNKPASEVRTDCLGCANAVCDECDPKHPNYKPQASAPSLLEAAAKHMRDRAATYDKPEGERSMAATVAAFNAITGRNLTEAEGWLLMVCLKMVRAQTRVEPHRDSIEDLIAYSALFGEARFK